MKKIKLTIELVPATSWFSNVRSEVSKEDWDVLRREAYKKTNYLCAICGGVGRKHPVECHEVWEYDEVARIQKLVGLTALCPACHEVKHIGYCEFKGRIEYARKHICKVNDWSERTAEDYIEEQVLIWRERSWYHWELDLTFLLKKGIKYTKMEST